MKSTFSWTGGVWATTIYTSFIAIIRLWPFTSTVARS